MMITWRTTWSLNCRSVDASWNLLRWHPATAARGRARLRTKTPRACPEKALVGRDNQPGEPALRTAQSVGELPRGRTRKRCSCGAAPPGVGRRSKMASVPPDGGTVRAAHPDIWGAYPETTTFRQWLRAEMPSRCRGRRGLWAGTERRRGLLPTDIPLPTAPSAP